MGLNPDSKGHFIKDSICTSKIASREVLALPSGWKSPVLTGITAGHPLTALGSGALQQSVVAGGPWRPVLGKEGSRNGRKEGNEHFS